MSGTKWSPQRIAKAHRSRYRRKLAAYGMAIGNGEARRQNLVDASPAIWLQVTADIGDYQYVEDGLDECLLRAVHDRVVYASRAGCHHEPAFQDITIGLVAAAERTARKYKIKRSTIPAAPAERHRCLPTAQEVVRALERKSTPTAREGTPLVEVVEQLFAREGKPLLEVVSELFDS